MPSRRASSLAVLLTPGAGTDATQPTLVAVERILGSRRPPVPVERMDFPYRRAGRRAPDRAPVLLDAVREGAVGLAERSRVAPERLVLGGRSMGGRMCSMAIADGLPALGLVCVSYPLHPPGKPDRLRVEHLPRIHVPCLFVSGVRDAFGTRDELESHTASIPGPVTHVWIEGKGADHSLKGRDEEIAEIVSDWIVGLA